MRDNMTRARCKMPGIGDQFARILLSFQFEDAMVQPKVDGQFVESKIFIKSVAGKRHRSASPWSCGSSLWPAGSNTLRGQESLRYIRSVNLSNMLNGSPIDPLLLHSRQAQSKPLSIKVVRRILERKQLDTYALKFMFR